MCVCVCACVLTDNYIDKLVQVNWIPTFREAKKCRDDQVVVWSSLLLMPMVGWKGTPKVL